MADEPKDTQPESPAEAVQVAVQATHPPEALRLGLADDVRSTPGKPFEKGQGKATVRTRWPVDSFDSGVKGVPVITAAGVEVERSKAEALNQAAAENDIELEEVGE